MTDIRELLNGIEKRAVNGPISDWDPRGGDEPHHRVIERTIELKKRLRADNANLVVALRAVLDMHRPDYGIPTGCDTCNTGVYPCETVRAITEALGSNS